MEQILKKLESVESKIDDLLSKMEIGNRAPPKRKSPLIKAEQFKTSTEELINSEEPKCAYMQKTDDCEGHCGRKATYSVIKDKPLEFDELDLEEAKDVTQEKLRKAFYRCNGCKNKGKTKENSRGYKNVRKYLHGQNGVDTAIDGQLSELMGSPKKDSSKRKSRQVQEEPDVEAGLDDPNPEDLNPHLKKCAKWQDKFVRVGKKNVIIRTYTDEKKKDVVIGVIEDEPTDGDYEESLKKPGKNLMEKIGLKYKTPEESSLDTPPKAVKRDVVSAPDSDSEEEDDGDENEAFKGIIDDE